MFSYIKTNLCWFAWYAFACSTSKHDILLYTDKPPVDTMTPWDMSVLCCVCNLPPWKRLFLLLFSLFPTIVAYFFLAVRLIYGLVMSPMFIFGSLWNWRMRNVAKANEFVLNHNEDGEREWERPYKYKESVKKSRFSHLTIMLTNHQIWRGHKS